jgi:hypothetical protein
MKKINPEDLVVGRKYLVEMELSEIDHDDPAPYCFGDIQGDGIWFHNTQPIYTHEESNDIELEMLVNVASRIYTSGKYGGFIERCVSDAKDLITVCKNAIKKGER